MKTVAGLKLSGKSHLRTFHCFLVQQMSTYYIFNEHMPICMTYVPICKNTKAVRSSSWLLRTFNLVVGHKTSKRQNLLSAERQSDMRVQRNLKSSEQNIVRCIVLHEAFYLMKVYFTSYLPSIFRYSWLTYYFKMYFLE